MWRKSISLVAVLIVTIACGSFGNPTPAPQEGSSPQGNSDGDSSNNPVESTIITLDSLETTAPTDIIQEIGFFGGLGGGCGGQMCVCEMTTYTSPALFASKESVEYLSLIQFQVCGVQENETATVTVESPGQDVESFAINSTFFTGDFAGYTMDFEYTPAPPAIPGDYHFVFSGKDWEFDQFINVFETDGPRLYRDNQDFLTFYKFQPNERVRLFAYENLNLIGWKELIIEPTGTLTIQTAIDSDFIAVGDISGQVFDQDQGEYMSKWDLLGAHADIYCKDSQPPSGITPIGNVELLVSNPPIYNYAYGTDSLTKNGTLDIEKGTILKISSNPICHEGSFYWLACIGNECNYMPESANQQAYLRPTTRQMDEIEQADNIPACPGTLPSRLSVGANAEVTTSGTAPQLSLRTEPSMSAEKVHVIAAGRDVVILDGPVCADDSYWWYIRSEQGFEGWAREGDNEDYWMDPLP